MYLSGIGVSEHSLLPLKSPRNFIANETYNVGQHGLTGTILEDSTKMDFPAHV